MVAHFATVEMDIEIGFSILSGPFECQGTCGIVPNGPAGLAVFQYTSGLEVLAYSINNDFNYVITMLQSYVHPELLGCSNL